MEFPRMVYRVGTQYALEAGMFDAKVVEEAEFEQAKAEGWHLDQYAAKAAHEQTQAAPVATGGKPTRADLEAQAAQLGVEFKPSTSDKKLAEAIAAKIAGQ